MEKQMHVLYRNIFKLLRILYKVKKHENLYFQYRLNLRQVAEK